MSHIFRTKDYPDLLAGLEQPDDAAVWRLDVSRAIVVTTDFFTPVVDDPYDYGAISAANSISDVYAMGAEPFLALNISAFPPNLPVSVVQEILRGGAEKAKEAGVVLAGGHTIQDKEPKYGLVVLGFVHPQKILRKSGAMPGDVLLLTKPLGSGVIATALKQEKVAPKHIEQAIVWMKQLNKEAGALARKLQANAVTDITGFGLLGHAWEMASASGVGIRIDIHKIPFMDGAQEYARQWVFAGGAFDNREYFQPHMHFATEIAEEMQMLLFDPQTSGGLLMAVPKKQALQLGETINPDLAYWQIGEITLGGEIEIF